MTAAAETSPKPVLERRAADPSAEFLRMMKLAREQSGKGYGAQFAEIARMTAGASKIAPEEYFKYRLYDDAAHPGDAKRDFIGARATRPMNRKINAIESWWGLIDDKTAYGAFLRGFGAPTPTTQALVDARRRYGAIRTLSNAEELARFFAEDAHYPIFAKPNGASLSLGVASIDGFEPATRELLMATGAKVPVDAFAREAVEAYGQSGYILQSRLVQHPEMTALCGPAIATIRIYTIDGPDGLEALHGVWKIPGVGAIADNFWREGALLALLDEKTGEITRFIQGSGVDQAEIETHPGTGAKLPGARLPMFADVVETCFAAAALTPTTPLLGFDVAVTPEGPVIVEANANPSWMLAQVARGRGALTPRFRELLAYWEAAHAERKKSAKKRHKAETRDERGRKLAAIVAGFDVKQAA